MSYIPIWVNSQITSEKVDRKDTEDDIQTLYEKYEQEIKALLTAFPKSDLIICTIPPRSGEDRERINEQIACMNEKLLKLAEGNGKIFPCNSYPVLLENETVKKELYRETDLTGIHLNDQGKKMLAGAIEKEIHFVYFLDKVQAGMEGVYV